MADDIINSNDGNDYLNLEKIGGSVILTLDKDGIGEKHNAQKFIDFWLSTTDAKFRTVNQSRKYYLKLIS